MTSKTSTNNSPLPSSSSVSPTTEQAYAAQHKPQSPAQIKASGDVKVKIGVLWLVGVFCTALGVLGGIIFIINPANAKDFWVITGPIISATMTGAVAYLTGDKQSSSK